jgi:hypothetical protein
MDRQIERETWTDREREREMKEKLCWMYIVGRQKKNQLLIVSNSLNRINGHRLPESSH